LKKKFSKYIPFLKIISDLVIINLILFVAKDLNFLKTSFLIYINLAWLIITYFVKYYSIYRTTHFLKVFYLYITQNSLFFFAFFSYFSLFNEGLKVNNQFKILASIFLATLISKFTFFYLLKWYRNKGKNYRRVIVIGFNTSSKKLIDFFESESDYGYRFIGFFDDHLNKKKYYLGNINKCYNYVLTEDIQEIYCSTSLDKKLIQKIMKFGNINNKLVKLIPDSKDLYSKDLNLEYYGILPILKTKKLPFQFIETTILKRFFDIIFSFFTITFVLSWLSVLLWIIIKLDSKGPLFFSQERIGINGDRFLCYKFRTMKINTLSNKKQATQNDDRITKVGRFLRKTSLDELPQFFNVLLGNMSVVGPRPHMSVQSLQFEKEVNNFIKRLEVKPGITGLAQIRGFRGEIIKKSDIENRVRLDIFYIENWSFFLDLKIIFQTMFNIFRGEEKAY